MDRNNSRRDILSTMVDQARLTPDGRDWITCALDPFHDFNHQLAGYPDTAVAQTLVSCYQYQVNVSKPPNAAGDWDAHIFTLPIAMYGTYNVCTKSADWSTVTELNPNITSPLSLLNIYTNAPGGYLVPANTAVPATVLNLPTAGNEEIASGVSRIVGLGFEVHNTTSALHKQGSVCTYRMPSSSGPEEFTYVTSGATYSKMTGWRTPQPPSTQEQALRMKTARTWEAKDGVYSTVFQSTVDNPLKSMSTGPLEFASYPDAGLVETTWVSPVLGAINSKMTGAPNKMIPFDTAGAFFMGLSAETTLTVKLRVYVEKAPTWSQPELAPLASPSAGYDITALELYAQAINKLPAAVKVDENAAGDWWRAVVNVLKYVAGPAGMLLNNIVPGGGVLGSAIQNMAGQINTKKSISKQVAERATEPQAPEGQATQTASKTRTKARKNPQKPN